MRCVVGVDGAGRGDSGLLAGGVSVRRFSRGERELSGRDAVSGPECGVSGWIGVWAGVLDRCVPSPPEEPRDPIDPIEGAADGVAAVGESAVAACVVAGAVSAGVEARSPTGCGDAAGSTELPCGVAVGCAGPACESGCGAGDSSW